MRRSGNKHHDECQGRTMEFKFQHNLDFQTDAISSTVGIFKSQEYNNSEYDMVPENGSIPNTLSISDDRILENLKHVQASNGITESGNLDGRNFSIEMETGTGKTYVYLRTVFELYSRYGFRKFIVVVPSVAIREGVLKTLDITISHFRDIYHNTPYRYYEYDSKKMGLIRQFARGHTVEIMIITIDAFNKDKNIMQQERDSLHGQRPIELIRGTNPILILDEPQNMETDTAKRAIADMNPLFTLRYSATHKNRYNLVYSLRPIDAYNRRLVKRIEVASVTKDDYNSVFLRCRGTNASTRGISARLEIDTRAKSGFGRKTLTVRVGDDLAARTGNPKYSGFVVSEIDAGHGFVKFANGLRMRTGEARGADLEKIMAAQIDHTVRMHLEKYESLKKRGIKPLSLFFIDRVAKYTERDGFIRKAFERSFDRHKKRYADFKDRQVDAIHAGYFSRKSSERHIKKDREAFDLIMRDKERLLSFDEPVSFVFSHSALREGWDNPNVFNICTLGQTVSEMKKRQEIGRGMRLPVDQGGNRITDEEHILTIIANESYYEYASQLQQEYIEEYGDGFTGPRPADARRKRTLALKKRYESNPEFRRLWRQISKKTEYAVRIDTDRLICECSEEIDKIMVDKIRIMIRQGDLAIKSGEGIVPGMPRKEPRGPASTGIPIPNIVEQIAEKTRLTRYTLVRILGRVRNLEQIFNDPQEFVSLCTASIQKRLADMLIDGIQYRQVGDRYEMDLFGNITTYDDLVVGANKTIYDGVAVDNTSIERGFAEELDRTDIVKLFVKMPRWFVIDTPVGTYNPDWAIVTDDARLYKSDKRLYFVTETKGTTDEDELRTSERRKIDCAREHFKALSVRFGIVSELEDLRKMLT